MKRTIPRIFAAIATALLIGASPSTLAEDYSTPGYHGTTDGEAMLLDTLFLRPVSLVGTVVGAAAWIVSLPFTLPSDSTGEAWVQLVEVPAAYTFKRPLGEITGCRTNDPNCRYPAAW